MIGSVPFDTMAPLVVVIAGVILTLIMASVISNTVTANLVMPLAVTLGTTVGSLEALGGGMMLVLAITFACSLAMVLPISTPPNALAYSTGMIEQRQMLRVGSFVGVVGVLLAVVLFVVLHLIGFFPVP